MPDQEHEELPWNEAKWERFLQESEARSARYGDLLETLIDHPDRDEIIEHEMGWDKPIEGMDEDDERFDVEEMNQICEDAANDPELMAQQEAEDAELEAMPAYRRGYDFGMTMHHAMKDWMESPDEDLAEDAGQAYINAHIVAAKLAGAHGMGYEDDVLCGAICVTKRSLAAANECLAALERLRERNAIPVKVLDPLIAVAKEVRSLVEARIAELRSKVWWE